MNEVLKRLDYLIKKHANGNISAFSRMTGVKDGAFRSWFRNDSIPGTDKLVRIADVCKVSVDWLIGSYAKYPINDVLKRIDTLIRKKANGNISSFSRLTKIGDSSIRAWYKNNSTPGPKFLKMIAEACGVSVEWILTGDEKKSNQLPPEAVIIRSSDLQPVPVLNIEVLGRYQFWSLDFSLVGGSEGVVYVYHVEDQKAYAIRMFDDSMAPFLNVGDLVILAPSGPPINGRMALVRLKSGVVALGTYKEVSGVVSLTRQNADDLLIPASSIQWAHRVSHVMYDKIGPDPDNPNAP